MGLKVRPPPIFLSVSIKNRKHLNFPCDSDLLHLASELLPCAENEEARLTNPVLWFVALAQKGPRFKSKVTILPEHSSFRV